MTLEAIKAEFEKLSLEEKKDFLNFAYAITDEAMEKLSPAWEAEIEHRINAFEDGKATTYTWQEVQLKINEKFGIHVDIPTRS